MAEGDAPEETVTVAVTVAVTVLAPHWDSLTAREVVGRDVALWASDWMEVVAWIGAAEEALEAAEVAMEAAEVALDFSLTMTVALVGTVAAVEDWIAVAVF